MQATLAPEELLVDEAVVVPLLPPVLAAPVELDALEPTVVLVTAPLEEAALVVDAEALDEFAAAVEPELEPTLVLEELTPTELLLVSPEELVVRAPEELLLVAPAEPVVSEALLEDEAAELLDETATAPAEDELEVSVPAVDGALLVLELAEVEEVSVDVDAPEEREAVEVPVELTAVDAPEVPLVLCEEPLAEVAAAAAVEDAAVEELATTGLVTPFPEQPASTTAKARIRARRMVSSLRSSGEPTGEGVQLAPATRGDQTGRRGRRLALKQSETVGHASL